MKKKPAPRKPVKGTWRPPSLRELWETQSKMMQTLVDLMKKTNDHGNEIYALQHPIAPDTANRVVNNQVAEIVGRPSTMMDVYKRVCLVHGHQIGILLKRDPTVIQGVMSESSIVLCLHCGMTLEEIRGGK